MRRALTRTQAAALWQAASQLPSTARTAFVSEVNRRLASVRQQLTDGDVNAAIVSALAETKITTTSCFMCDGQQEANMAANDYDDDDDAFGPDGLLRDGKRTRVSLMMKDGMSDVQRAIAHDAVGRPGFDDSAARHQPGPVFADRAGLERKARAYAEMVNDLENAWRNPSPLAAPAAAVAPRRDAMPAGPFYDAAEGRRIKAAAYQEMVDEMTNAWRGPAR